MTFIQLLFFFILVIFVAAVIYLAPLGTCHLGTGSAFNSSYAVSDQTIKCSLFNQWARGLVIVRM